MKICTGCGIEKPLTDFRRDKRTKDGHGAVCTQCNRKSARKYRERNLDECNARMRKWKKDNPKKYILWRAQQHARQRGQECTITIDDFNTPEYCPIFGVKLNYSAGKNDPNTASLDRIDSSKGYVRGNVHIISWRANSLKNSATPDEMKKISLFFSNKPIPVLPTDSTERNQLPMADGLLDYFPLALAEVSRVSKIGNDQHNPGQPMHWARGKSTDHANKIIKHLVDRGAMDIDNVRHSAKVAWRALAMLQEEMESAGGYPGRASKF